MSKPIELSPRLEMVAGLVPKGARLVDVGTDHAYLPAALLQRGAIPGAIAADLRRGPLDRAKSTVRACGLSEKVSFRLCDGLFGVIGEEVDAIVIAGMGGETIAGILAAAPWTRERNIPLILQPMSAHGDLRQWLGQNGYTILEERLAKEGDALYLAMLAVAGKMPQMTPAELEAGRLDGHPLRGQWLDRLADRTSRALEGLSKAKTVDARLRQLELERLLEGLTELKKEWEQCRQ